MRTTVTSSLFTDLICSKCGKQYPGFMLNSFAACCKKPLLARYATGEYSFSDLVDASVNSMWRYAALLPIQDKRNIVSLGEGNTPIMPLDKLSAIYNTSVLFKDEALNPTGSFKARGISAAVSKAKELGVGQFIIPTAGNAGGALAAYCAKAGMKCIVIMPEHTPGVFKEECRFFGAELILVKGLINDCAARANELNRSGEYFDVSTLKEPYRLEGKKTMGFEIAEQLKGQLPDVIVYPAGGGTGLIGIWKAFYEMIQYGWIKSPLPRMIAVQSENCAPIAAALNDFNHWKENFTASPSIASGLAVPYPFGMDLMLQTILESNGEVLVVSEKEILEGVKEVASTEGVLLSPEGSAAWTGVKKLLKQNKITEDERVLFLNTGSAYKYIDNLKA